MKLLREPLLYFLLTGGALFAVSDLMAGDDGQRVVVSEAERARLAHQWQAQMGREPTPQELDGLVEQWVREEIYYREALAMGLGEDDVIIRRRLAQKLAFLSEDVAAVGPPDEEALRRYYRDQAERYAEPARYSFSHVYFSGERRADAEADATAALASFRAGGSADGDPFMLPRRYEKRSGRELADLLGRQFAEALAALPSGRWTGPVRSAYGWHLVKVDGLHAPRQPAFEEVAREVTEDYKQARRQEANEAFYEALQNRYEVVRS